MRDWNGEITRVLPAAVKHKKSIMDYANKHLARTEDFFLISSANNSMWSQKVREWSQAAAMFQLFTMAAMRENRLHSRNFSF